jgi:homoserine kinase
MRVRSLGLKIAKQAWVNPCRTHLGRLYPTGLLSIRHGVTDRLPLKLGLATLRLRMEQVTVRIPASTSNLGPGFDCLGVALRIYNSVTVAPAQWREEPHPQIVSQAAGRFFKQARRRAFPFSLSTQEKIPRSRGLGSSATIRLGILHALNHLSGDLLDRVTLFELCAELEGHPDNAAPASFGGFTVVGGSRQHRAPPSRFGVSPRLFFVLLIPELEIRTSIARKLLPSKISHAAAVENCANACAITAALASKNYEKLRGAFADFLHQPFRAKMMPFFSGVIAAAERAGALGGFLSGSGSTICAVTLNHPHRVAAGMSRAVSSSLSRTIVTRADNQGVRIIQSRIIDH